MKRPRVQPLTKKQRIQQAKERGFILGVRCGASVSKELIKSGWTNLEKLEGEVLSRVQGE
jgi:hypothetical protein